MIGCPLNGDNEPWHTARSIPSTTSRLDLDYLKALVNKSLQPSLEYCTFLSHTTGRQQRCG